METNMKKIRETDLTKLIKNIINEKKQLTEDKKFTCHECHPTGRWGKGECHHVASTLGTSRPADCMSWDDCLLECEGIVIDYDKVRQNTGNPADTYGGERRINEETEWGCCCEWQSCDHPVTKWYSKMCCIGGWGCRCNGRPLANIAPADNEKDCRARCKDNSECQEACISGRIPPSTSPRGEEGLDMSRIRIRETDLTKLIKNIINESQLLLEVAECTIYSGGGDDCPDGYTCKPDPNSTLLGNCCMDSNGKCCDDCMDDRMVHTDDTPGDAPHSSPKRTTDEPSRTLSESDLKRVINRAITERKKRKPKKIEDNKYTTWCKEHGWEHGVGEGCAEDALDSKDVQMRSWAIGFMMGDKQC